MQGDVRIVRLPYMVSIKKNLFYNGMLTVSTYVFPLLVFPYVTRVLGVHNLGICNFVDSIIQYFILFSFLGMQTMASREIAKVNGDKQKLNETFSGLLTLNILTTIVVLCIFFSLIFFVPKFYEYRLLLFIGSAKILANTFLVEWFFVGTENFKYVTIRTIIIRSLYVLSIFLWVNDSSDYVLYFTLSILMFVCNAIVNIYNAYKQIDITFESINIHRFVKSFLILGLYQILTSMYTSFNVAFLGFVAGETDVGYYTVSSKIFAILLGAFTAFTSVMLPRMSSIIEHRRYGEFKQKISASIDALLCFSMPIITIVLIFAPIIIRIIAGIGYEDSILLLRMMVPLMLIIGYEQILVLQVLTPMNKDQAILINSIIGALVGVLCNVFFVPHYGKVGSAIAWLISEVSVLIMAQYFVHRYIAMSFPVKRYVVYVLGCIPVLFLSVFLSKICGHSFFSLLGSFVLICLYYYFLFTYILKNQHVLYVKQIVKDKLFKCTSK